MEVVEDPLVKNPVDMVDKALTCKESYKNSLASDETIKCQKSNGDAESEDAEHSEIVLSKQVDTKNVISDIESLVDEKLEQDALLENKVQLAPPCDIQETSPQVKINETSPMTQVTVAIEEKSNEDSATENLDSELSNEKDILIGKVSETVEPIVAAKDLLESATDKVTFETEILVEANDNEPLEHKIKHEPNTTPNILSELGQSIEFSEALRVSDVTDNTIENNNCSMGSQEMFNKEELLDILEGNDENEGDTMAIVTNDKTKQTTIIHATNPKRLEAEIAMNQLNRLKSSSRKPRKRRNSKKIVKEDVVAEKAIVPEEQIITEKETDTDDTADAQQVMVVEEVTIAEEITVAEENKVVEVTKEESIVSDLVKDWEEEEQIENVPVNDTLDQNITQEQSNNESSILQDEIKQEHNSQESTPNDQTGSSKSRDDGVPQRRLGRVIKKKVIFDPDNPDTFTKTKSVKPKDNLSDKEQPPLKKTKVENTPQILQRSKSKSPISKLQWKKPTPKNSSKIKRPSEIDKLLMDEGALNMIYQLTPEAPKGKKNMKTKAEFIKKIQSSTPDSKEMKFRERKKEAKYEEGEAKKILGGKHRTSLSSSVKSPSVSEDFEAHSADDSIIYRRHSSSSYSSSCMSPRRLSDVEGNVGVTSSRPSLKDTMSENHSLNSTEIGNDTSAAFMGSNTSATSTEIINKDDCLSIKKKLNSKLALALNKRKRESGKTDKPLKQKKLIKSEVKSPNPDENIKEYKHLSVNITDRLGEILIRKSGCKYNLEVISEIIRALECLESRQDLSVILLTSECGTLCSGLDLNPLLHENNEVKTKYAHELAESVRSLLCLLEQYSKLVCTGVDGTCWGVGLALVALSDVCVASERAVFQLGSCDSLTGNNVAPLLPGLAVFTANHQPWSRALLNDLMIFGRQLSAVEALQSGLVSRNIWPERFLEQLRGISTDLASVPVQNVLLKKKLLKINNGSQSTFLSCLEKERDLLVQYWLSAEGQDLLRAHVANSERC